MLTCHLVQFPDGCALLDTRGATIFCARGRDARVRCLVEAARRGSVAVV
jgi:hypothetical protein